jgi:hypothetical protein
MFISINVVYVSALFAEYGWHIVAMAVRRRPLTLDCVCSSVQGSVGWLNDITTYPGCALMGLSM